MIYKCCFYRISNSALQDLKLNNKIYKLHDIITSIEEKKSIAWGKPSDIPKNFFSIEVIYQTKNVMKRFFKNSPWTFLTNVGLENYNQKRTGHCTCFRGMVGNLTVFIHVHISDMVWCYSGLKIKWM